MTGNEMEQRTARDDVVVDNCQAAQNKERDVDLEARLLERRETNTASNLNADNRETTQEAPLQQLTLSKDTTCGFWFFKGSFFQSCANEKMYVLLYGLVGCVYSMTSAYFSGTITTMEKRFHIPSKNTGIISVGNNISQIIVATILSFYAGKGHRPRWIGFGLLTIVIFCLFSALPHLLYGAGEQALMLTRQFGGVPDENATISLLEVQRAKTLCRPRGADAECELAEGNLAPQVVLFIAQFISGIGVALYFTLGISYMDDNTDKSKAPAMLSISFFLNLLGPAIGFALASYCLSIYIAPQLNPVIGSGDPRWLGAWWLGWLLLALVLVVSGTLLSMFPKELPQTAARRLCAEKQHVEDPTLPDIVEKTTLCTMLDTIKRLSTNKILMYNNISSVFYFFGYTPYWIFTPKYIEIQYRLSAATSSLATGSVPLTFTAVGILLSGFLISKLKPRARYMAAWNVLVGLLTVVGVVSYIFIGCAGNDKSVVVNISDNSSNVTPTCNSDCHCNYVPYAPVCGENNLTYISACHAGCKQEQTSTDGAKLYVDCACIPYNSYNTDFSTTFKSSTTLVGNKDLQKFEPGGQAVPGACPVDCFMQFVIFLAVMCSLKFLGAAGRTSNLIVSVRCVDERDKTAAMAYGMVLISLLTFIPSPIFFGWLLDRLCLVWGKTCTNKGNCWLYDPESLRYILNSTAAVFIAIGALLDCGVWYYVKDLKVFDDEVGETTLEMVPHKEKVHTELEK